MNNLIINILFLLSIFSVAVLAEPNVAAHENLSKNEKTILTVAIEEIGYYPFNYIENAVVKGFSVDFLESPITLVIKCFFLLSGIVNRTLSPI